MPGALSTMSLSCWSDGVVVVLLLEGGRSASLLFSPFDAAGVSFGIVFFSCCFVFLMVVAVFFYFSTGGVRSKPFTQLNLTVGGAVGGGGEGEVQGLQRDADMRCARTVE